MPKDVFNDIVKFRGLARGIQRRTHYRIANKKGVDVVRNIEILKIKLMDIDLYLDPEDIYPMIQYLNTIELHNGIPNFVLEKPEREEFWMTIWKYERHCTEEDIIVKIGYKKNSIVYNASTRYSFDRDVYSPAVYTELNLLRNYLADYIFPILVNKRGKYIDPLKFIDSN